MKWCFFLAILLVVLSGIIFNTDLFGVKIWKDSALNKNIENNQLKGVFEVINIKIASDPPMKEQLHFSTDNSNNRWIFEGTHFNKVYQLKDRTNSADCQSREMGFFSESGIWYTNSNQLFMQVLFSSSPPNINQTYLYDYKITGDELVLVEHLIPTVELPRKGNTTITLRRIE